MQLPIIMILAYMIAATQPDTRPANPQEPLTLAQREVNKAAEELAEAQRNWEDAVILAAGQLDTIPEVANAKKAMVDAQRKLSATSSRDETAEYFIALKVEGMATTRYALSVFANASHLKPDERLKKADEVRDKAMKRLAHAKSVEMELRQSVEVPR